MEEFSFFEGLDQDFLQELAELAQKKTYADRDPVIRVGAPAENFFIITKGQVNIITDKLENIDVADPAPVAIQTLGPGEVLGWSWLVEPHQWRFEAKAVGATEVLAVDGKWLRNKCESDPALGYEILKRLTKLMAERLYATRCQLSMHGNVPFKQFEGA